MSESKDELIKLQQEQLARCTEVMGKMRCRIAELEYHIHQHDLLYLHPWQYFLWRIFIWPFRPENKKENQ
jgi:hypothetical protein